MPFEKKKENHSGAPVHVQISVPLRDTSEVMKTLEQKQPVSLGENQPGSGLRWTRKCPWASQTEFNTYLNEFHSDLNKAPYGGMCTS